MSLRLSQKENKNLWYGQKREICYTRVPYCVVTEAINILIKNNQLIDIYKYNPSITHPVSLVLYHIGFVISK